MCQMLFLLSVSEGRAYIELPSFHMFSGLSAGDNHDEFRDLSTRHPFIQLRHDLLDVSFDLVVGGDWIG